MFGFLSYFLYFYQFTALRDSAALNLGLCGLALVLALICVVSFWKRYSKAAKCLSVLNVFIALSCLGMLAFYVFVVSSKMPSGDLAKNLKQTNAFTLTAAGGEVVTTDQGAYEDKYILLSFYRGYW